MTDCLGLRGQGVFGLSLLGSSSSGRGALSPRLDGVGRSNGQAMAIAITLRMESG